MVPVKYIFTRNHWRHSEVFNSPTKVIGFWYGSRAMDSAGDMAEISKWRAMSPSCGLSVRNFTKRSSTDFRTYLLQTSIFNIHFPSRLHPWSLTIRPWKMVVLGRRSFPMESNFSGACPVFHFRGFNHLTAPFLLFNDIQHRWKTWHLP